MAQLSLWNWVKKQPVGVPDPSKKTKEQSEAVIASANWEVDGIYKSNVAVNVHSECTTLPSVRAKR